VGISDFFLFEITIYIGFIEFPNAWELERDLDNNDTETKGDESNEEEDGDESDTEDNTKKPHPGGVNLTRPSRAYQEFLSFLESGCAGSPLQGYPAIMVIVSTIPSSVRSFIFFAFLPLGD
jgi:hypothetical protein